jgi:carbamoyl-phosphate synthase small subunit
VNSHTHREAVLALADGTIFRGTAIGADGSSVGEVVFNTALTGYQEILTDPSYARQIVTLTYPHIGNTGVNKEDEESDQIWAAGLVIRDLPLLASNFRSEQNLDDYLKEKNILGIADIDTRKLTRILRETGAQSGCIMAGDIDDQAALSAARGFAGLKGMDLAKVVTTSSSYSWNEHSWELGVGHRQSSGGKYKVVAYDYGVKRNILRMLVDRDCDLTVVPAQTPANEVLAMKPDGVFLSNGPGDPEPCDYAIQAIKEILDTDIPVFGICLGHQLLALASGAKTAKMKFGHHGANHPVEDIDKNSCDDHQSEPWLSPWKRRACQHVCGRRIAHCLMVPCRVYIVPTSRHSAFRATQKPAPVPHDAASLFDHFIELMEERG